MEFGILGPLQVIDDSGAAVHIAGGRERALLALLLLSANRVVSSRRLAEDLWGEQAPDDPAHALRVHVSRLRRALREAGAEDVIVTRPTGYIAAIDAASVDLGRFETLVAEARQQTASGDHAGAASTLRDALALWRGPALDDAGDAPLLRAEAGRLDELRLAAIEDRVEAEMACGRHADVVGELDALTREHPVRERLWGLRMLALYRAGRPADALRAYQELRTTLGEELGLQPSPALSRLEGAILRHDRELDWSLLSPPVGPSQPTTKYARVGGVNIAYQVVGAGAVDVILIPGFVSNVDVYWANPGWVQVFQRLTHSCRLILWDKRGTGLSDPVTRVPTLDERSDDLLAVMDAAGSERAVLFGISEGGPMGLVFAASHPDRVRSLILYGVSPRFSAAPDWPHGFSAGEQAELRQELERDWGGGALMRIFAPTEVANENARQAWGRTQRAGASPGMGLAMWDAMMAIDCRDILAAVRVPTLVLHRRGDRCANVDAARYMATHIPGARLVETTGDNHLLPAGDVGTLLDEVDRFIGGPGDATVADRVLTTVVCVDFVEDRVPLPAPVENFGGRELTTSDTPFVAAFSGPSRAIAWASAIEQTTSSEPRFRIGVHTGECEVRGDEVDGLPIRIAAATAEMAAPGELLVTGTVKDLVAGSDLVFAERGVHHLPAIPGEWSLFAVV